MSGHSKWSTIKHKKAKVDAARGVSFQKFSREIIVAAKLGGGDPSANFRLRTAIERAKAAGLPNDNIKRAIEKGSGSSNSDNYEELTYEGYAAGGVAVMIEVMTDNRNRTAGDVRSYFSKYNGNLGENGCVGWMFKQVGSISVEKSSIEYDNLFESAINLGAQDLLDDEEETYTVITSVEDFQGIVENLEKEGIKSVDAKLTRLPENTIEINDVKVATQIFRLLDKLEDHDDVQNVYANYDIPDEIAEQCNV